MTPDDADDTPGDAMSRFAASCRLRVTAEPLYHAPYDVLEPPSEAEQAYLVHLGLDDPTGASAMRLVFVALTARERSSQGNEVAPTVRDVLWWLAADAWAVEHARRDPLMWAAHHGFDSNEPATRLRFDRRLRQATDLSALLGEASYRRLLTTYADMSGQHGKV